MLRLLGDKKKPLATRVKQTLKLVEAVRDVSDVTIPKTMRMILYKKYKHKMFFVSLSLSLNEYAVLWIYLVWCKLQKVL